MGVVTVLIEDDQICMSDKMRKLFFLFFLSFFFFKQKTAYEIGVRLVGSEMCIRDRPGTGAGTDGRCGTGGCGGEIPFLL